MARRNRPEKWSSPPFGHLRLDVDASYNEDSNLYSVGRVVRNHDGNILLAFGQNISKPLSVAHGELIAIRGRLKIVSEKRFQNVHVMNDSLLEVQGVTCLSEDLSYTGACVSKINDLMLTSSALGLKHIRRITNELLSF